MANAQETIMQTTQAGAALAPADVIDLERYPIDQHSSAARVELIAALRDDLAANQYCVLPGFIREEARQRCVEQAKSIRPLANHISDDRNCYLQRVRDDNLPDDHPRNILSPSSARMLGYHLIPSDSPIKTLYHWDAIKRMIAEIVGVDQLYDNEDPFQPANMLCFEDGDRSSWHFDSTNAFTVTLMLQRPEGGGAFQMSPNTRTQDDPCLNQVRAVVSGQADHTIVDVARDEGSLCIFRGCNSLHRVTPIEGKRLRIMGVFVYENEPGVVGDMEVNETVYGPSVRDFGAGAVF